MRSTIDLTIEITHSKNLPDNDAQLIATSIEQNLTRDLALSDPLASVIAKIRSAIIKGSMELTIQAIHNE